MELKDLDIISLDEVEWFDALSESDKKNFIIWCDSVFTNPWFAKLISRLIYDQTVETFTNSDTTERLNFGRAVVMGIDYVSKAFRKYANEYTAKYGQNKPEFKRDKMFN